VEGDVLKCSDWIYSHGELPNPPGDNRFESSEVERERFKLSIGQ
jgi:hypothetical protein